MKYIFSIICFFACFLIASAQDDFKFSGEFRVRTELDGRDFNNKTYPQSFTALRVRLNFEKKFFDHVTFFAQVQDSRVFGSEKNTLNDIHNLDLHQGFVKISNIFNLPMYLQLGRFKIAYGNFVIFGPNDWHNVGRSHDGFRLGLNSSLVDFDAFLTTHTNFLNYRAGAADIRNYDYTEAPVDSGFNIYGFYSTWKLHQNHKLDFYGTYEWDRKKPNNIDRNLNRYMLGLLYYLTLNNFKFSLESAYQFGSIFNSNKSKDIDAFMVYSSFKYSFPSLTISLNTHITSGGKPTDSKYKLFDNPYSTKHNHQGFMDFFTGLSNSYFPTGIYGLNDLFLRLEYQPKESKFSAQCDLHYFTTFVKTGDGNSVYGPEINLLLNYNPYKGLVIQWGSGVFFAGDAMKELYRSLPNLRNKDTWDPSFWTYLQFNFAF